MNTPMRYTGNLNNLVRCITVYDVTTPRSWGADALLLTVLG